MTDFLSPAETQMVQPGQVVVNIGQDVWKTWANASSVTGAIIGMALTSTPPGGPFQVVTLGRFPSTAFNLGPGTATSVVAGNVPSRTAVGQVIGTCDASGEIFLTGSSVNAASVTIPVTSAANLTALRATGPSASNGIMLLGNAASGDGGGGEYAWKALDTRSDDGGQIVAVTGISTGRWVRITDSVVNVKDYGAKGDVQIITNGVTNGTTTLSVGSGTPFTTADQGKIIVVTNPATSPAGGSSVQTTIAAVISSTQVTLGSAPSFSISNALVHWGTDDTSAVNLARSGLAGRKLYFPAGPAPNAFAAYMLQAGPFRLGNGETWVGDGASRTTDGGKTNVSGGAQTGTLLLFYQTGTALAGPAYNSGSAAASNVINCGLQDLQIAWTPNCRGQTGAGAIIGLSMLGMNDGYFKNVVFTTPQGSQYIGVLMYTRADAAGAGCYQNTLHHVFVDGDEGKGTTPVTGAYGFYMAQAAQTFLGSGVDGGGSNANLLSDCAAFNCDISLFVGNGFGNKVTGLVSEAPHTLHIKFGDPAGGFALGNYVEISFSEGNNYAVEFGDLSIGNANVDDNIVDIGTITYPARTGTQGLQGLTNNRLIHPNSCLLNNIVRWGGGHHGSMRVHPLTTQTPGVYQGVMSGQVAAKLPASYMPATGLTLAQLNALVSQLVARMQYAGTMEPFNPEREVSGVVPLARWRADQGLLRYENSAFTSWADMFNSVAVSGTAAVTLTASNAGGGVVPLYQDKAQTQQGKLIKTPWIEFYGTSSGGGFLTGTFASATSQNLVVHMVIQSNDLNSRDQGIFELTPAGTIDTGISIRVISGKITARVLTTNIAQQQWNGPGGINFDFHVVQVLFSQSGGNATATIFVDGAQTQTGTQTVTIPTNMTNICVGALGGGASGFWNGGLQELIVYPGSGSFISGDFANLHLYSLDHCGLVL